jgi:hypothetical protein
VSGNFEAIRRTAAKREHGSRARYVAGCKCMLCRAANSRYESERKAARQAGDWNGLVGAKRARRHILRLSAKGIGHATVADAAKVPHETVRLIRSGAREKIRARTERKILDVTMEAAADCALVDAGPTWRRIRELIEQGGFSKAEIARRMGFKTPALQIGKKRVWVRTASRVERFWRFYLRREGL